MLHPDQKELSVDSYSVLLVYLAASKHRFLQFGQEQPCYLPMQYIENAR